MKYGLGVAMVVGVLASGCMTAAVKPGPALVHPRFPYGVTYDDEARQSVLGDDWRLENYRKETTSSGTGGLERKKDYEITYELDFDDDEKSDANVVLPYPDFVFLHRRTNARIEVSTVLLDEKLVNKELRVLLNDMVESKSGTRSLFVGFGKAALGVEKRFATRLLDSEEATLGDQKGLVATIERADLDQLQLNPKARWGRSRLFMLRAPFSWAISEGQTTGGVRKYHSYGVLLLVEYSNTPEDFEGQYPEYVRLMNKIHLLTDDMLLAYLGGPLSQCSKQPGQARVQVAVSEDGSASLLDPGGVGYQCGNQALRGYYFPATGARRTVSHGFDFTKPQRPDWLTLGGYQEQRPPSSAEKPAAPAANDAEKAAADPAPAAAPPASTPASPSAPPPNAAPSPQ